MVGKQERRYQRMITVVLALISLIMVIPLVLLVVASLQATMRLCCMDILSSQKN